MTMSGERDESSLISKRLRFSQRADLFELLRPSLGKRVFHVTPLSNLELILAVNEIQPTLIPVSQVTTIPSSSMSACGSRLTVENCERWRPA